jgi:hypothetical protein
MPGQTGGSVCLPVCSKSDLRNLGQSDWLLPPVAIRPSDNIPDWLSYACPSRLPDVPDDVVSASDGRSAPRRLADPTETPLEGKSLPRAALVAAEQADWTAPAKLEAGSLGSQPARDVMPRDRWNASSYSDGGMFPQ